MADEKVLEYKVKLDRSDVGKMQKDLDKVLDTLSKIENFEKDKEKRRKNSWGGIGKGMAAGGAMVGGGAMGMGVAGMGGSMPGLYAGAGVAVAGAGKLLASTVRGMSKVAGDLVSLGGTGSKGILKKLLTALPGVGDVAESFMKAAGLGMAALGQIAGQRMEIATKWATFEKAGTFTGLSGARGGSLRTGPKGGLTATMLRGQDLGMTPTEVAGMGSAASSAAGFRGSMAGVDWMGGHALGVGAGATGSLAGTGAANRQRGGAGSSRLVSQAIRSGVLDGLRGSRLTQYIGQAAGVINQLGQQGISTNRNEFGGLMVGIQKAIGKGGAPAGTAGRVTGTLAQMPGQAKQRLLAPFQEAAQGLILAEAAKGGGGLDGIIGNLEGMGAKGALGALAGSPGIGRYALAGGAPISAVDKILGAGVSGATGYGAKGVTAGKAARTQAATEAGVMLSMDSGGAASMIGAMGTLQGAIQDLAGNLDSFLIELPKAIKDLLD